MRWGRIPAISQYVLIFIAVTFTWLMGLMGYVRSGLRQHWHVYGVIRDNSADAFTPTLGFATQVVSVTVLAVLPPDRLRVLDHEPARPARFRAGGARLATPSVSPEFAVAAAGERRADDVMTVPLIVRIGALVLATTAFYAYVGQMVPQKEVQPPQETVLRADLTTADMVKVGREIMEGKGLCLTCHTIGKTGALRFPDLDGRRCPREDPRPGPERCRVLRPVDVRTRRLHRAGIQSGDAADQQASDRPHRSGDPLRDRVPPDSWRHADGHAADDSPLLTAARRHRPRRRLPRRLRLRRRAASAAASRSPEGGAAR